MVIKDNEVWSHSGDNTKPDADRFENGNVTGISAKPPKHSDHNFQMHRSDINVQALMRDGILEFNLAEKYSLNAKTKVGSLEYISLVADNVGNTPASSPSKWLSVSLNGKTPSTAISLGATNLNDINSHDKAGFYFQDTVVGAIPELNYPINHAGSLEVLITAYVVQIYRSYSHPLFFTRTLNGAGFWKDWETFKDSSEYAPTVHTHTWSQITGIPVYATRWGTWDEITGKPTSFPPSSHTHTTAQVTGLDAALAGKAPTVHTHTWSQITGVPVYTTRWAAWGEVTGKPTSFPPSSHTHTTAQVTGLDAALAGKAPTVHTHTWSQITGAPVYTTRWASWGEVSGKPATFTPPAASQSVRGGAKMWLTDTDTLNISTT